MDDASLHRLHEFIRPSSDELDALSKASSKQLTFERKQAIRRQGDPVDNVYLLLSGWVASCVDTANGRRQIVKIHLPGDFLGVPSICLEQAAETLVPLTQVEARVIPLQSFAGLFGEAPRLGFALFMATQQERVMLMDRITSIGRTTAPQRIAALLLHVHDRLNLLDHRSGTSFELPLTQEDLAQATGLTAVHINRTFQDLDKLGVIERRDRWISLTNLEALRELAALPVRKFVRELRWLDSGDPAIGSVEAARR